MKQTFRFCQIALLLGTFSSHSFAKTFKIATIAPAGTAWLKQMKKGAEIIKQKYHIFITGYVYNLKMCIHHLFLNNFSHVIIWFKIIMSNLYMCIICVFLLKLSNSFYIVIFIDCQQQGRIFTLYQLIHISNYYI